MSYSLYDKDGNPDPIMVTVGLQYLARYMMGETVDSISKSATAGPKTIKKFMRAAAKIFLDGAQEEVFRTLIPIAVEAIKVHLEQEIADVKAGKTPKTNWTERVMKGMYVFDTPLQMDKEVSAGEGDGTMTLSAVLTKKLKAPPKKELEATTTVVEEGEVVDGDKNNPADEQED